MTDHSGVVLAGGRSRRFGEGDKALAELDGEQMVVRVVDRVTTEVEDVAVSCRPEQVDRLERARSSKPDVRTV